MTDLADVQTGSQSPPTTRGDTLRRVRRKPSVVLAASFNLILVAAAIAAPLIARYDPNKPDASNILKHGSSEHWLGTDQLGRDVLSRLIYGTRISLQVSVLVVVISLIIAVPFGLLAGYKSGWVDSLIMRVVDAALSIPSLVLTLAIVGLFGPGVRNVIIALSATAVPRFVRVVRGASLSVREKNFVEASRSIGSGSSRILRERIFPNIRSPLLVYSTLAFAATLLSEAGLSYLGYSAPPPAATWGNMLRQAYDYSLFTDPVKLVIPGVAIALTVLAFNALGDGLGEVLGVARIGRVRRIHRRGITTVSQAPDARVRFEPSQQETTRAQTLADVPNGDVLLRIQDLSLEFETETGPVQVLDRVSLTVGKGEIVGLVGESGSGKTVTALSVTRLLPSPPAQITGGRVLWDGQDLLQLSRAQMRKIRGAEIAMVFQDPMTSLNPSMTIGKQLICVQRVHFDRPMKEMRREAIELLERVGIPDPQRRFNAYPHELSGGMRQRLMIAMALACRPRLLIADEPTTALDVTVQAQILELLQQLQADFAMGILFVTHDLGVVAQICDRVAVMYAGQVVEQTKVDDLFDSPWHPYTEGLLGAMPQVGRRSDRLTVIRGRTPDPHNYPHWCRFASRCAYSTEACTESPIHLTVEGSREIRCIRHSELVLSGSLDA